MKNVVLITGGFDPIHSGHLEYIRAAKDKGDVLVVGLQSDEWLKNKKGVYFLPFEERCNGGDRTPETAPPEESNIQGVTYLWGVGGEKTNSSSVILKKYLDAINKNK
jgi:cytidyltransferase-like protein